MGKRSGSSWWSSIGFGARPQAHAPDTDFADMGTAFGLDASFGDEPPGEPRTMEKGLANEAPGNSAPSSGARSRR